MLHSMSERLSTLVRQPQLADGPPLWMVDDHPTSGEGPAKKDASRDLPLFELLRKQRFDLLEVAAAARANPRMAARAQELAEEVRKLWRNAGADALLDPESLTVPALVSVEMRFRSFWAKLARVIEDGDYEGSRPEFLAQAAKKFVVLLERVAAEPDPELRLVKVRTMTTLMLAALDAQERAAQRESFDGSSTFVSPWPAAQWRADLDQLMSARIASSPAVNRQAVKALAAVPGVLFSIAERKTPPVSGFLNFAAHLVREATKENRGVKLRAARHDLARALATEQGLGDNDRALVEAQMKVIERALGVQGSAALHVLASVGPIFFFVALIAMAAPPPQKAVPPSKTPVHRMLLCAA
jgi:hypothetical protein